MNRVLKDLLHACILDFGGSWEYHLPLIEFSYNNSFQVSIGIVPFEALHRRPYRSTLYRVELGDRLMLGLDMIHEATYKVAKVKKHLKVWVGKRAMLM